MAGTADHPIAIVANPNRICVLWRGTVIADTTRALSLSEASYPAVHYIPREDVALTHLVRTAHRTHCPYKGDASYYSISIDGVVSENAIWSYEAPLPDVAMIAGHLAFYPSRVDRIEEIRD